MINITEEELRSLTEYIQKNYGLNLTKKKTLIEGRLNNLLIEKGFTSFSQYISHVFADQTSSELATMMNKLTTNHTFFMRESNHFNYLKEFVLPQITRTMKEKDFRIWSAGCSSGEEPYTLSMILQDYFGEQAKLWDAKVLATDISLKALDTAKLGIYTAEAVESLPNVWKQKYFTKLESEHFKINDKISNEVIFRTFNLMENVYPFKKKFNVIFCRNVMIYFNQQTKIELVNKFYENTEPGGYLFIGHSESINKETTKYKYIMPAVYQKEML